MHIPTPVALWLMFASAVSLAIGVQAAIKAAYAAPDPLSFARAVVPANLGPIASVKPSPLPDVKYEKRSKKRKIATK